MSDLTIFLIGFVAGAAGYVVGYIHALVSYHKRVMAENVMDLQSKRADVKRDKKRGARMTDHRYDPKQFRGGRHE